MNAVDRHTFQSLRKIGALTTIETTLFPRGGIIKIACPDGDATPELLTHMRHTICRQANSDDVCTHQILIGGGPAAIPKQSPIHNITHKGIVVCHGDDFVFAQIELAVKAKNERVRNLILCPHCACAAATLGGLTLLENLFLTFRAKDMIRAEFPHTFQNIKVLPHLCCSDTHPASFRTYLLRREPFLHYYENMQCSTVTSNALT